MKIIGIFLLLIVLIIAAVQLYFLISNKNIEQYPYVVLSKNDGFEIRQYEARLFSKVTTSSSDYSAASRKGFSKLAAYIFGDNDKKTRIAMTSPVTISLEDSMQVMFLVPKIYSNETLPLPNNKNITHEIIPSKKTAVISFGGWANAKKIKSYQHKLDMLLSKAQIKHNNKFLFLGYNAPFEWIMRKNEIMVTLHELDQKSQ